MAVVLVVYNIVFNSDRPLLLLLPLPLLRGAFHTKRHNKLFTHVNMMYVQTENTPWGEGILLVLILFCNNINIMLLPTFLLLEAALEKCHD